MDGTHRKRPNPFKQIYVIGGCLNDRYFCPAALFCLVPNHEAATYFIILQFLKENVNKVPKKIIIDFEQAMLKTIHTVYDGGVEITGCFFHFKTNILKNMKSKGSGVYFNSNEAAKQAVRLILCLPYCPPGYVIDVYEAVVLEHIDEFNLDEREEFRKFMEYFESTYLGKPKRRGKTRWPPSFSIDKWNIYHEILNDTPMTNNGLEQWNGQLNANQPGKQTVQKSIRAFQREVTIAEVKRAEITGGTYRDQHPGRTKKLVDRNNKLKLIIVNFELDSCKDFVNKILPFV